MISGALKISLNGAIQGNQFNIHRCIEVLFGATLNFKQGSQSGEPVQYSAIFLCILEMLSRALKRYLNGRIQGNRPHIHRYIEVAFVSDRNYNYGHYKI